MWINENFSKIFERIIHLILSSNEGSLMYIPRGTLSKYLPRDHIPFSLPLGKITRFMFTGINASARSVQNVSLFSRIYDPYFQLVTHVIRKGCRRARSVKRESVKKKERWKTTSTLFDL